MSERPPFDTDAYLDHAVYTDAQTVFGEKEFEAFLDRALAQINDDLAFASMANCDWEAERIWNGIHRAIGSSSVIGAIRLSLLLANIESRRGGGGSLPSEEDIVAIRETLDRTGGEIRSVRGLGEPDTNTP